MNIDQSSISNRVLRALPAEEFARLCPDFERCPLGLRQVLHLPHDETPYVHFLLSGVVSLLTTLENGSSVELATVGNEGMVDISVVLGLTASETLTKVQVPGEALRMPSTRFREHLDSMPALRRLLGAYVLEVFTMTGQNVACNRMHSLQQRLARWLLYTRDRVVADEFEITHEFLSEMLGAGRPTITMELAELERAGAIQPKRGRVAITDRQVLQARACECYELIRERFERLADRSSVNASGSNGRIVPQRD